jgi:hypothetical protein
MTLKIERSGIGLSVGQWVKTSDSDVGREGMTAEEIASYEAGYQWNEDFGDKKNWD